MKIMLCLFLCAVFLTATASRVQATEYLGDFCWHVPEIVGDWDIRLGVSHMGGQHFVVYGRRTRSTLSGNVMPITGNGEVVGNRLMLQITSAGYVAPNLHGYFGTMEVDLSTLEAKLNEVDYRCNNGVCTFGDVSDATYTYISCY